MQKATKKPTDSELNILLILWEKGPSNVRSINDELSTTRDVGYTTTLKILQIMNEKGLVTRIKDGRNHIYSAAVEQNTAQQQFLDKLLTGVFGGSAKKLIMQALGTHNPSKKELEEIREYIQKLEGGNL
jgi:predicted transcriptional regulator